MTKIERKTQKIFAGNADTDELAVFGSMISGTPVYNDDIEALQSEAYTEGWKAAVAANEAPFMEEMNAVQYGFSKQLAYLFQQGIAEWDAGTTYYLNSFCQVGGVIYKSMQDENINHSPADDTEGTYWSPLETGGGGSGGLEVCDIGMALYVDETKGLRRRLNGTTVSVNTNTQTFVNKLKSIVALYPSLACTEAKWSQIESASDLGQVGKFVIQDAEEIQYYAYSSGSTTYLTTSTADSDSVNVYNTEFVLQGTGSISSDVLTYESQTYNRASGSDATQEIEAYVRLPKVVNIQGLIDLQNLGVTVAAGLPNITGQTQHIVSGNGATNASDKGALKTALIVTSASGLQEVVMPGRRLLGAITIDASLSNPIYGNSTTVQPEAIQYPYYIQIATGQETEVNIRNDIESIVPYTLFDSKYSEAKQYNASRVLGGSILSKSVYPTAYEAALVEYNSEIADGTTVELPSGGSYTKRGVSGGITVKLSTDETVTEYDWKLDTMAEILTVPTLNGSEDLLSDRYDDLELKASSSTYVAPANGWYVLSKRTNAANQTVVLENHTNGVQSGVIVPSVDHIPRIYIPAKKNDVIEARYTAGGDLDTFRFIYAKGNGSLYFFVASVAQNAPLANLGRIEETKVDKNSSWGFPSNRYIDLELGASGSTYTAPANGWYYLQKISGANNQHSFILALKDGETATEYGALEWTTMGNNGNTNILKVPKGKKVQIHYNLTGATEIFRFIYAEGSY